jgi:hypothetical protein
MTVKEKKNIKCSQGAVMSGRKMSILPERNTQLIHYAPLGNLLEPSGHWKYQLLQH